MPPRNASVVVPVVSDRAVFEIAIPPEKYREREYYAARDACSKRGGVLQNLREALRSADGRTVNVSITIT